MKRALLFMTATLLGFSGFSQTTDTLGVPGYSVNTLIDTVDYVYQTSATNGSIAGINNNDWKGFAQLYTTFVMDSGWSITGSISVWLGNVSTSSTNTINISVWGVDSGLSQAHPVSGLDSITGFPKAATTGTAPVIFGALSSTINSTPSTPPLIHPTKFYKAFSTPIQVNRPFFLGYTFGSGYSWATKGSEVLALATTPKATGGAITYYDNIHNNYLLRQDGSHKVYLSLSAYNDGSIWKDYNWDGGFRVSLSIVPVVQTWADNVPGITKNNLTFFGGFPNPAKNNVNVKFALKNEAPVTIEIMDMTGRTIKTIDEGHMNSGEHTVNLATADLANGTYLYMIQAGADAFASQMTIAK